MRETTIRLRALISQTLLTTIWWILIYVPPLKSTGYNRASLEYRHEYWYTYGTVSSLFHAQ